MRKIVVLLLIPFILNDYISESIKQARLPLFIGVGYDLPLGNPTADKVDPGFRASIFDFSYAGNHKTEDEKYLIPDGITARMRHSCSYASTTNEFTGVHEFQNELRGKVSISGAADALAVQAGFSASIEFAKLNESSKKEKNVYISSGASCEIYNMYLPKFQSLPLSEDFKEGVKLALDDKAIWKEIIEYFGTHYVVSSILGGRMILTQKIKETAFQELKGMKIDIQLAAKFKYAQYSGDLSTEWKSHTKEINSLTTRTDELKEVYVGGKPPKSGNWKDWQEVVGDHPAPILYEIASISDLFTSKNFSDLNQGELNEMKKQFLLAVDNYCKLKKCFVPGPDRPLPPGSKATPYLTAQYGGNGGVSFKDTIPTNPVLSVQKVLLTFTNVIVNIQLFVSDGNTSYYTPVRGGTAGTQQTWEVPQNEFIAQIEVRAGVYIDSLTFITNKGTKSPKFGGNGGTYRLINLTGHLVGLFGRSGFVVDALGFVSNEIVYPTSQNNEFLKELN